MTLPVVELGLNRPLDIEITEVTQPFWESLSEGLFRVAQCPGCERLSFPPRAICPACHCREHRWVSVSGRGTLYSITKVHSSPVIYGILSPMRVAIIDLEEGLRIVTRVLPDGREPELDSPVQLVITHHPDGFHYAAKSLDAVG
jgi:uncharacterized OB-fold protein